MARKSREPLTVISRTARAKINLDLLITGRRDDGYHLLDSLVVFADYGDEIHVRPSEKLTLTVSGPFAKGLADTDDNLVLKAARLLRETLNIQAGAEICLVKNLPVASGIGGGSADAAATLLALLDLWAVDGISHDLDEIALSLGADIPVCLRSRTMHMKGTGEILSPLSLNFPLFMLLVNPGVQVSTSEIFKIRTAQKHSFSVSRQLPDEISTLNDLLDILSGGRNDLTDAACALCPEIILVLDKIQENSDCAHSAMSGSGATCYGLFTTAEAAAQAAVNISGNFPNWWFKVC
ncbi:4-diphosphocytidyl-2-C-methyl-D-erythritol kinase [hydrothermal vent metagenome]|uniref:4-(cytidine 5'-diphospho)-2-C-methyl-D-erythritol kinase n=1 Tax=hydrothermal vent metagenome TaxID=652676 RepID=A0A3B0R9P5_9ZZZZ